MSGVPLMPLSWNEIRHRAISFLRVQKDAASEMQRTLVLVQPRTISPGDIRSISEKGAVEVLGREEVGRMLQIPLLFGT
jgi:hypothetical protein